MRANLLISLLALCASPSLAAECGNKKMPAGATPLTAAELTTLFSGKTWMWKDGGGAYFSPDGKFTGMSIEFKSVGTGTWTVSDDGKFCYQADWKQKDKSGPYGECYINVKAKGRYYNASQQGNDKGKWWCSEASRKGIFGTLKDGDLVTAKLPDYIKKNGIPQ